MDSLCRAYILFPSFFRLRIRVLKQLYAMYIACDHTRHLMRYVDNHPAFPAQVLFGAKRAVHECPVQPFTFERQHVRPVQCHVRQRTHVKVVHEKPGYRNCRVQHQHRSRIRKAEPSVFFVDADIVPYN